MLDCNDTKIIQFGKYAYNANSYINTTIPKENATITKENATTTNEKENEYKPELSPEQQYTLNTIMSGANVFVSGPAGVGKSLVIRETYKWAQDVGVKIQVTALTGCASITVGCGATTIHSWSGIRLGKEPIETIVRRIVRNSKLRNNWTTTRILVVDEVSMMSKKTFDLLDQVGRLVRGKRNLPFGGIQLIFSGDFYQLSPIPDADDTTPGKDSGRFCFESDNWNATFAIENQIQLTTIFRQTDPVFQQLLSDARRGVCSPTSIAILTDRLNAVFEPNKFNGLQPTEIFPTRNQVASHNSIQYSKLSGSEQVYLCTRRTDCTNWINDCDTFSDTETAVIKDATVQMKTNEVDFLLTNTLCVEELKLKLGAVVMCTVNLDLAKGICNGSTGIVKRLGTVPTVKFWNGVEITIPMHWWQSPAIPCSAVGQIPLVLAWSMTIHKTQGITVPHANIDIGKKVFTDGQAYVAMSRVRTLDGLFLSSFLPERITANAIVTKYYNSLPVIEYEFE